MTPASGWEKGQVKNQVGVMRRRFFVPRPNFKSYAELNAWLEDRCQAYAQANTYPEMRERTIWEVFEEERPSLVPYVGPFDGFHAVPAAVSKICLIRFDKNRYSVDALAVVPNLGSSARGFRGIRPPWDVLLRGDLQRATLPVFFDREGAI